MQPTGKTAVITGAARGIGAAVAQLFAAQGAARLILIDLDQAGLLDVAAQCRDHGAETMTGVLDIGDRTAIKQALGRLCAGLGRVDCLVNNAGICDENDPEQEEIWERVIRVNLHGTYQVTLAVLPYLADGGRIINIASILGRAGKLRNTAYSASKHGVLGLTKSLALDLAARKITVNAVLPGWVDTPMLRGELDRQAALLGVDSGSLQRNARRAIPLRRLITPDETAALVAFLASDAAAGITAQGITIDGGFMCGA